MIAAAEFSQRLIRFIAPDGQIYHGDAILPPGIFDIGCTTQAHIIMGDIFGYYEVTGRIAVRFVSRALNFQFLTTWGGETVGCEGIAGAVRQGGVEDGEVSWLEL